MSERARHQVQGREKEERKMKKKSVAILCGAIAFTAAAGGTLLSALASEGSDGPGQAMEAADLGLGSLRELDAFKGIPLTELAKETADAALAEEEEAQENPEDIPAPLDERIDPDLHVAFSDGADPDIDEIMTATLPETIVYQYLMGWGDLPYVGSEWEDLYHENLNTILNAYHAGTVSREEYYRWMKDDGWDNFWPEVLYGQDAFDNFLAEELGGLGHGAQIGDTGGAGSNGGSTQASANTGGSGNGGGSGSNGGGNGGGGSSSGGSGNNGGSGSDGGADNTGANGGYDTAPDPGVQESWGDTGLATEEGVADFFSDMGGYRSPEDAANAVHGDYGNVVIR